MDLEISINRRKAFAVAVLAEVWAGAVLPKMMIRHALAIRSDMIRKGLWMQA